MGTSSQTTLILNYLPQDTSEAVLRSMFSKFGTIRNTKIIRDKVTGLSLGYGFLDFDDMDAANSAISEMNGYRIENKTIRVSFARPSSSDIRNANIYISGLPKSILEDQLLDLFSGFGSVITHKVLYDSSGESRGVGFVRYDKRTDAETAIREMNNYVMHDESTNATYKITVKFALPPSSKPSAPQSAHGMHPYAAPYVPPAYNPYPPADYHSNTRPYNAGPPSYSYGPTPVEKPSRTPEVPYNAGPPSYSYGPTPVEKPSRTPEVPYNAGPPSYSYGPTPVEKPSRTPEVPWCVFVYGLQPHATEANLYELFGQFGAIVHIHLMRNYNDPDRKSRGFGFVNYERQEDACQAVAALNNQPYDGKVLQVRFKSAKYS